MPKRSKPLQKKKRTLRGRRPKVKQIIIDREQNLIFRDEADLYAYFDPYIQFFENDYRSHLEKLNLQEPEASDLESELDETLDSPDEIWNDQKTFAEFPVFHFIRQLKDQNLWQIAICYVSSEDEPTFIFLHFVTDAGVLLAEYRKGDLVFDKAFEEIEFGMLDGDALSEGDPLAMGLFISMLKVRSDKDIAYDQFQDLGLEIRQDTIESADEIWRHIDLNGNTLVTFVKEVSDGEESELFYIAVTQEDVSSKVHSLLYSFPTNDEGLVDRFRRGENLQAEEVVQESSH